MTVHVISTGWQSPSRERCLMSVRMQSAAHEHHYIEASVQSPPRTKLENLHDTITTLHPEAIVALVDGDDHLCRADALTLVQRAHDEGAWVTWGSFEYGDGRPGFAADLDWSKPVRAQHWVTTHLKTFRAGLFHRIALADLMFDGKWIHRADDVAYMLPIVEMAGRERCKFIPQVVYAYNFAGSFEREHGPAEERAADRMIRSRAQYERIAAL